MALVLLLALACGGPAVSSQGPRPKASAVPAPAGARLSEWQRLGATEVPPTSLQKVSLHGAQVVNQTGGAVSDADARTWAGAFMRTFGYLLWAVSRGQDGFLIHSGLSSSPLTVFQPNLNDIIEAHRAGDRVEYTPQTFRRLVVRPVPPGLQASFQRAQYVWKPYAIYLDAIGPAATNWIDPQGGRTVKSQVPAGVPVYELVGGELGHDALMGDVWVLGSDFDCTAASSRETLAPLCNP